MIERFSSLTVKTQTPNEIKSLLDVYYKSFQGYSDNEIKRASEEYIENGEYFPPKPFQIISLVQGAKSKKHDQELKEAYICNICHERVSSISEGKCLDCAGFVPGDGNQIRLSETHDDFTIEGRRQCSKCGKIDMCIKEPKDSRVWECRDCYSGLTKQERTQRFRDIQKSMGNPDFKPDWYEEIPF